MPKAARGSKNPAVASATGVFCECFFLLHVLVVRVLVQIDSRCDAHVVFIAAIR